MDKYYQILTTFDRRDKLQSKKEFFRKEKKQKLPVKPEGFHNLNKE
jgi:hypothetical protein